MKSPMNKPSIIAMQWGCIVVAIVCALVALWGYFGEWLNIGWVITLAYCEMASLMVAFVAWYCRWYLSDEFVVKTAKYAVERGLDPRFVAQTVEVHPRKADIMREIERQRGE